MNFDTEFHVSSVYSFDIIVVGNDAVKILNYWT